MALFNDVPYTIKVLKYIGVKPALSTDYVKKRKNHR